MYGLFSVSSKYLPDIEQFGGPISYLVKPSLNNGGGPGRSVIMLSLDQWSGSGGITGPGEKSCSFGLNPKSWTVKQISNY